MVCRPGASIEQMLSEVKKDNQHVTVIAQIGINNLQVDKMDEILTTYKDVLPEQDRQVEFVVIGILQRQDISKTVEHNRDQQETETRCAWKKGSDAGKWISIHGKASTLEEMLVMWTWLLGLYDDEESKYGDCCKETH